MLRRLGIRPGEGGRVALAGGFQLAFVAGVVLLKSASNAVFLHRSSAESLPLLYLGSAALAFVGSALSTRVSRGGPFLLVGAAVVGTALQLALGEGFALAPAALYLFAEAYATSVSIRFWSQLGEIFDPREGRRLFGLVGGFAMAGSIGGGLLASASGQWFRTPTLVWLGVGSMLLLVPLAARLDALRPDAPRHRTGDGRRTARWVLTDRFPRTLALLAVALALLTALADFSFRLRARALLGEDALAALFGGLNVVIGVLGAVFQFFLTGPLLKKLGIFRYLALIPSAIAASAGAALLAPGLWPAYLLKAVESLGSYSVNQAGLQLLYGPMPDDARGPARAFIDGFAKKGGLALGGAMLLGLRLVPWDRRQAAANLFVVATVAGTLLLLELARRLYLRAVEERLEVKGAAEALVLDEHAHNALETAIARGSEEQVLAAVHLLRTAPGFSLAPYVERLLDHPSERVRALGAKVAGRANRTDLVWRLMAMVEQDARRPREESLRALAKLAPDSAPRFFGPRLRDPDPGERAAAIAALIGGGEPRWRTRAEESLRDWLDDSAKRKPGGGPLLEPPWRRELVKLLGRLPERAEALRLIHFFEDPDPSVRRLAAAAAGKARDPSLLPALFEALGHRTTRRAARTALSRFGDAIVPEIAGRLNDRSLPLEQRNALPRLLRYIATPAAAHALLFSNIQDDARLRYRIATALWRLHEELPEVALDRPRLHEAIHRRLSAYRHYLADHDALAADADPLPEVKLLCRAVADRLDQNLEIAFRLAGMLFDSARLMACYRRFLLPGKASDFRQRAYAAELVEATLDADLKPQFLAVLDDWHRGHRRREAAQLPEAIRRLLYSNDDMLRECAVIAAAALDRSGRLSYPFPEPHEKIAMPNPLLERVLFLETVELFSQADVDDLAALAAICKEKSYAAGETVFAEDELGETLFTVMEGEISCTKGEMEILRCGPRDSFGESSFLDQGPRPVGATAVTAAKLLIIDRADFMDLVADRPEVLKGLFAVLTRHLREVLEKAVPARKVEPAA